GGGAAAGGGPVDRQRRADRAGEQRPPDRGHGPGLLPPRPRVGREVDARPGRLGDDADRAGPGLARTGAAVVAVRRGRGVRRVGPPAPRSGRPGLRLLYLNPTGVVGGAEMCLLDVLAALRESRPGWSARVLLGDDGPLRPAVEALGVPCDVLPLPARVAALGDAGLGLGRARDRSAGRLALAARGPAAAGAAPGDPAALPRRPRGERPERGPTNGLQ